MAELAKLKQRINELNILAIEIASSAQLLKQGIAVQPRLSEIGQRWYRGARELLVQNSFSGIEGFDACYEYKIFPGTSQEYPAKTDIERFILLGLSGALPSLATLEDYYELFATLFGKARSLLAACVDEIESRELSLRSQLSFEVAADEFLTAQGVLDSSTNAEPLIRASGVIARVALERHLFTVIDARNITLQVNPPSKRKPEASDAINSLVKAGVINAIQRSELESLFTVANHCAHPRETVTREDVRRLIGRGRELASVIS